MIFNLPPILGFLPLVVYVVLTFRKMNIILVTIVSVLLGAILTGQGPVSVGLALQESLGSFLALIGFIIVLGAGLGEVLKRTGIAKNIVYLAVNKMHIQTAKQGLLTSMILSCGLAAVLGTGAGANAVIAPIVIPILARIGVVPGALGIVLQGGMTVGLMIGPFTPLTVTFMGLGNLTYAEYMLSAGIPLSLIIGIVTFLMALRLNKKEKNNGGESYQESDMVEADDFKSTPEIQRATYSFVITMLVLIVFGVFAKAGASYAIVIMLTVSLVVGITAKMKIKNIMDAIMDGGSKLYWLFFLFLLYNPFLDYVAKSGAFDALVNYIAPLVDVGGKATFMLIATLIGIFGISGAAVAQAKVTHDMFVPTLTSLGISMPEWTFVNLVGAVVTSYVMPNPDNISSLGLARSGNVKGILVAGYVVMIVSVLVVIIRALVIN